MIRRAVLLAVLLAGWRGSAQVDYWLWVKMNRFAETYNLFAQKLNQGEFDVKLARKLSKQWRDVERCGMWPRPKGGK